MQKIIIQTAEGRKFLVCADFPEPEGNTGFIKVSGFKLEECQDLSLAHSDEPNYIIDEVKKILPHIEIKTCTNETSLVLLQRKRKPFSFQNIFGSGSRYYYESKFSSDVNVTIEEIFF